MEVPPVISLNHTTEKVQKYFIFFSHEKIATANKTTTTTTKTKILKADSFFLLFHSVFQKAVVNTTQTHSHFVITSLLFL